MAVRYGYVTLGRHLVSRGSLLERLEKELRDVWLARWFTFKLLLLLHVLLTRTTTAVTTVFSFV